MWLRWILSFAVSIAAMSPLALGAEIVDRIVAVVEGKVVTQSEAIEAANVRAFQEAGRPVTDLSGNELREGVDRLIDRKLIEKAEESSPFSPPEGGEAEKVLEEISARFSSEEELARELALFHLTYETLSNRIYRQYSILAFIDYRLRPQVLLSPESVDLYYRETFLPKFRESAAFRADSRLPSLEKVGGEVERVLTENEINRLLNDWLHDLRVRARIKLLPESESHGGM